MREEGVGCQCTCQELRLKLIAYNGSVQALDLPEDIKDPMVLDVCPPLRFRV